MGMLEGGLSTQPTLRGLLALSVANDYFEYFYKTLQKRGRRRILKVALLPA